MLEYVAGGALLPESMTTAPIPEKRSRLFARDMLAGLKYLHDNGIVHGDIKPANILIGDDGSCKFTDFGVSHISYAEDEMEESSAGKDSLHRLHGTPIFMAPELWDSDGNGSLPGATVDIWALGCTLFQMLYGSPPFMADTQMMLMEAILNDEHKFPSRPSTSDDVKEFLSLALTKKARERPDVYSLATHAWVTERGKHALSEDHAQGKLVNVSEEEIRHAFSNVNGFMLVASIKFRMHSLLESARLSILEKNSSEKVLLRASSNRLVRTKRSSGANNLMRTVNIENFGRYGMGDEEELDSDDEDIDIVDGNGLDDILGKDKAVADESFIDDAPLAHVPTIRQANLVPGLQGAHFTSTGIIYGADAAQGNLHLMEDRFSAVESKEKSAAMISVFDGHAGSICAEFLKANLHTRVLSSLPYEATKSMDIAGVASSALELAFDEIDKQFLGHVLGGMTSKKDIDDLLDTQVSYIENSGSTAVVLVATDDFVHIAHVGDSRAVGFRISDGKAVSLTADHKAGTPAEQLRIEAAGGCVASHRVNGVIAVSRSFGDIEFKTLKERVWKKSFKDDLLSCTPDVVSLPRSGPESMDFFILATDGVWDRVGPQTAVNLALESMAKEKDLQKACVSIIREALFRDSDDDISVIIMSMGKPSRGEEKDEDSDEDEIIEVF